MERPGRLVCVHTLSFVKSEIEGFYSLVLYGIETPTGFLYLVNRTMLPELLLNIPFFLEGCWKKH